MGQDYLSFPPGGIDPWGYVTWPGVAPDAEIDKLVKSRKIDQAFNYCLNRLHDKDPDKRLYYAVKGASLGYQDKKGHLIAVSLLKGIKAQIGTASGTEPSWEKVKKLPAQDLLAYSYARSVCSWWIGISPDSKYPQFESFMADRFNYAQQVDETVKSKNFSSLSSRYVKSVWLWLRNERALARRLMENIAENDLSSNPRPQMTLVRFWATGGNLDTPEAPDFQKSYRLLDSIRSKWPSYDRAIYYDGLRCFRTGRDGKRVAPERGRELLRHYLEMGTGPLFEIKNAKRLI